MIRNFYIVILGLLMCASPTSAFADYNVILMRHALAPGFGDPANFQIDDCDKQRVLNEKGRIQARDIGKSFEAKGLKPTRILTSPWCRCIQTAQELGLGSWTIHPGLSSFYEGHVRQEDSLPLLLRELEMIAQDELVLMITHQVVIQALTGRYVDSGGYLLVNSQQITWP